MSVVRPPRDLNSRTQSDNSNYLYKNLDKLCKALEHAEDVHDIASKELAEAVLKMDEANKLLKKAMLALGGI